jgi:multidrug efflux pump subunit AcrB
MVVHLRSPNARYDSLYLSNYATLRVRDELARLQGVGQALVFGAGNYAMRIWLDPEKASARNLTAGDIVRAVREQNVQVSAGVIGGPPQPGDSTLQLSINAQGRLVSVEEFEEIVLKTIALSSQQRRRGGHRYLRSAGRQFDCAVGWRTRENG